MEKTRYARELPCLEHDSNCLERRRDRVKFMKTIMIVALLVTALGLGACAQHKEAAVTTTAGTTGYAK
jgi:hypothetical protein